MALTIHITGGVIRGGAILSGNSTAHPYARGHVIIHPTTSTRPSRHVAFAKKFSPRGGKNRRGSSTTTSDDDRDFTEIDYEDRTAQLKRGEEEMYPGYFLPKLPGDEPDFFEGEQWDGLGFFVEYLWAFGFVFALIACGIAVVTYNEGATDFKDTPAYKESIQTREFLDEPDASSPDVFESNPTEVAPSLE